MMCTTGICMEDMADMAVMVGVVLDISLIHITTVRCEQEYGGSAVYMIINVCQ